MKCVGCGQEIETEDLYFYNPTKGFFCEDCVKFGESKEEDN